MDKTELEHNDPDVLSGFRKRAEKDLRETFFSYDHDSLPRPKPSTVREEKISQEQDTEVSRNAYKMLFGESSTEKIASSSKLSLPSREHELKVMLREYLIQIESARKNSENARKHSKVTLYASFFVIGLLLLGAVIATIILLATSPSTATLITGISIVLPLVASGTTIIIVCIQRLFPSTDDFFSSIEQKPCPSMQAVGGIKDE